MIHKPVNSESGNIQSAGYDPETRKMEITFASGKTYEYGNVAPEKYAEFEATFDNTETSTGRYFNQNFRSSKNYRVMDNENQ